MELFHSEKRNGRTNGNGAGALPPVVLDASPDGRSVGVLGALVERCGRPANDGETGRYRRAAVLLEQAGADAGEVAALVDEFRSRWPHLTLTPIGVANNVSALRAPAPVAAPGNGRRRSLRETLALLDDGDDA